MPPAATPTEATPVGEGRQAQPMRCVRFVTLATVREVVELALEQVGPDEVECSGLSCGVALGRAGDEAIEILAPQLFRAGSALHPVALEVASVQLIEERRRIAANQDSDETEGGHNPRDDLIEPWPCDDLPKRDVVVKPGLEHAERQDNRADDRGRQHSPVEAAGDREETALLSQSRADPRVCTLPRFAWPRRRAECAPNGAERAAKLSISTFESGNPGFSAAPPAFASATILTSSCQLHASLHVASSHG